MSDAKTYVFGQDSNCMNWIAPLLQQKGIDPNVLAMMNNGGFGNGNWIWILFLILLFGRNGFGGYGDNVAGTGYLSNQITNTAGRDLLMQAITGNGTAVQNLASSLNCDINSIKCAINGVQSSICQVGNQVGMSGQQIINAIQAGNCQISHQIADCCCNVRTAITTQGYENQLATINQTNALQSTMNGNNQAILARLDAMSNQVLLDKIDALREKNSSLTAQLSNEHQTAAIQAYQAQSLIPVNAALQDLSTRLGAIECKQPATVTVPYIPAMSNLVPVSYSQPVNFSTVGYNTCGC